jgi:hypothetical protein
MLSQIDDRVLEIVTILVVMMTIFVCICYAAIFRNPYAAFNPFKPPTATPRGMAEGPPPTFPPTWTPTATGIPTVTPTATDTPTVTNTPTSTSTSTSTPPNTSTVTPTSLPTATPADTPTITPTPTPRYTLNPAKPPEPITFCAYTEIRVNVVDYDGLPKQGVSVHIWSTDLGFETTMTTDSLGRAWKRIADGGYFDATWNIQLLEGGAPASDIKSVTTSSECGEDDEVDSGYPTVWVLHFKATGR